MNQSCVKGRQWCPGPDAALSDPPRCTECIAKAGEQRPSKELFPGEPTAPWDRRDLAGPPLNEAAWTYELRSYYERWQRGARDEIENLRRENVRWENAHKILLAENERLRKPSHEREPPHCSNCSCGMEPAVNPFDLAKAVFAGKKGDSFLLKMWFETQEDLDKAFDVVEGQSHEPCARPNLLRDETSAWEVQTQDSEGNPVVTCHTRVVGGVLCRWWGDDAPPSGVEAIDRAAQPPGDVQA